MVNPSPTFNHREPTGKFHQNHLKYGKQTVKKHPKHGVAEESRFRSALRSGTILQDTAEPGITLGLAGQCRGVEF